MTSILVAIMAITVGGCSVTNDGASATLKVKVASKEEKYKELYRKARHFCEGEFTSDLQISWCMREYIEEMSE